MDGSFTIGNVVPGDYYVIAELPGYVSPLSIFSRDMLNHPTKQDSDEMAALLTPVTVTSNNSARAEVSLVRGGVIAGAVRFEDGMPDEGSRVLLMRRDAKGNMTRYFPNTLAQPNITTDDQGHFRFAGLPEGEYTLSMQLAVQNVQQISGGDVYTAHPGTYYTTTGPSWLTVYFGNVFRLEESKSIKLTGGFLSDGDDIEIPLSKLHSVSGTVVDVATGAPVNQATVRMILSGEGQNGKNAPIGRTDVGEDGSFNFPFVPEGSYKMTVSGAQTITRDQVPVQFPVQLPGDSGQTIRTFMRSVEKTAQKYDDASQPIVVHGETTGVTVMVKAKAAVVKNTMDQQ